MKRRILIFAHVILALTLSAMAAVKVKDGSDGMRKPSTSFVFPQHWSYRHLSHLRRARVIKGVPVFHFGGGKTFTRGQIAGIIALTVKTLKKERIIPSRMSLKRLRELIEEYSDELLALEADRDLGYVEVRKISDSLGKAKLDEKGRVLTIHGSYTFGYGDEWNKDNTDLNNSLAFTVRSKNVTFDMSLSAEKQDLLLSEPELREFDLGGEYRATIESYSLEAEHTLLNKQLKLKERLGFTGSSTFMDGLTVGNLNLEGIAVNGEFKERQSFEAIFGRTQSEPSDMVGALHVTDKYKDTKVHLQAIFARYDPLNAVDKSKDSDIAFGLGFELQIAKFDTVFEYGNLMRGGEAFYLTSSRELSETLFMVLSGRQYRNMEFDYASPPVYAGISGGDAAEERGYAFEVNWQTREDLSLTFIGDTSDNPTGNFYYLLNEGEYKHKLVTIRAIYEREWAQEFHNQITNIRLTKDFRKKTIKSSLTWTRERIDGAGSVTSRLTNVFDVLPTVLSLTTSMTIKRSDSGHSFAQQYGINWNISAASFLALQADFSDPDASSNKLDLSYLVKF